MACKCGYLCRTHLNKRRHQRNAVLIGEEDWRAIEETLFLMSVPDMAESIMRGGNTPLEECLSEG